MNRHILVVEDDASLRNNVRELLTEEGFDVTCAGSGADGIALAKARVPHLIICDVAMPGVDGHDVLRAVREHPQTAAVPFVFLSARAERADIRAGMNLGADDYLTKPFALSELLEAVTARLRRLEDLAERTRVAMQRETSASEHFAPSGSSSADGIVVLDPEMRELYAQAARAANSSINVLISGETGVGKEIFARAIHDASPRKEHPFVALNCAALTESLLEAELFGHEKGAYTGANQARIGLLEAASGGTVLLDEIGELPLSIQTKLLRAVEERTVLRIGARSTRSVDVRFIAATNRDLEKESAAGRFREDLYYRLNGMSFVIPALRQRPREIAPLCRVFLARARAENGRQAPLGISPEALELLEAHGWPGNIRELRNAIERAAVLCAGELVLPEHLTPRIRGSESPPTRDDRRAELRGNASAPDRERILDALEKCAGNQTRAAELLEMSRRTLVNRLNELGIPRPRKRE